MFESSFIAHLYNQKSNLYDIEKNDLEWQWRLNNNFFQE